jgi:hypothetical protein
MCLGDFFERMEILAKTYRYYISQILGFWVERTLENFWQMSARNYDERRSPAPRKTIDRSEE